MQCSCYFKHSFLSLLTQHYKSIHSTRRLAGCYESLSGGLQAEALTDFTGGVCERYNFRNELPSDMFAIMHRAARRGALMGCSIDVSKSG